MGAYVCEPKFFGAVSLIWEECMEFIYLFILRCTMAIFDFLSCFSCFGFAFLRGRDSALDRQAFTKLGFGFEEKCWCYETCAAVLHLGNISFSGHGEGSQVSLPCCVNKSTLLHPVAVPCCRVSTLFVIAVSYSIVSVPDYRLQKYKQFLMRGKANPPCLSSPFRWVQVIGFEDGLSP